MNAPITSFRDARLDCEPVCVRALLEQRVVEQVDYAWASETPAVVSMMREAGITPRDIQSLADFEEKFPILTKRRFREFGSEAFLPDKYRQESLLVLPWHEQLDLFTRYTGGTSIRRIEDFCRIAYSHSDWHGLMQAMSRLVLRGERSLGRKAFINYTYDHIAAPFFSTLLVDYFGLRIVPRPPNLTNEDAFALLRHEGCDMLATPPTGHRGKGNGLDQMLLADSDIDNPYLIGAHIKTVWTSSTPLTPRMTALLARLGIDAVIDIGGSTDTGTTLMNCAAQPNRFHIMQGHVYFEVLDEARQPVAPGERGRVVVSRVGGEVEADPLLTRLLSAVRRVSRAVRADRLPTAADADLLSQVFGQTVSAMDLQDTEDRLAWLQQQSARLVPNQATQILRFSGTMNTIQYLGWQDCGCGRRTECAVALERVCDYDELPAPPEPDRLVPPVKNTAAPAVVSQFRKTGFDGCGVSEA